MPDADVLGAEIVEEKKQSGCSCRGLDPQLLASVAARLAHGPSDATGLVISR